MVELVHITRAALATNSWAASVALSISKSPPEWAIKPPQSGPAPSLHICLEDQMNRVWLIVLIVTICAGLAQDYITEKAAERITTIRQSCVIGHGCKNM